MKKWSELNSPYDWKRDQKLAGIIVVLNVVEVFVFTAIGLETNNPLWVALGYTFVFCYPVQYWVVNRVLGTTIYKWKEHKEKMKKRIEKKRKQKESQVKKAHFPDWAWKDQEEQYVLKLGKSFAKSVEFCGYETIDGITLPANVGTESVWDALDRTSHKEIDVCEPKLTTVIAKAQFMTRWEVTLAQKEFGGQIKRVELCDPLNTNDA